MAAACAYAIARNHPFVDGNKRASLLSIVTFLGLNDVDFIADEAEAVVMILGLAAYEIEEEALARWLRDSWPVTGAGPTRTSSLRPQKKGPAMRRVP